MNNQHLKLQYLIGVITLLSFQCKSQKYSIKDTGLEENGNISTQLFFVAPPIEGEQPDLEVSLQGPKNQQTTIPHGKYQFGFEALPEGLYKMVIGTKKFKHKITIDSISVSKDSVTHVPIFQINQSRLPIKGLDRKWDGFKTHHVEKGQFGSVTGGIDLKAYERDTGIKFPWSDSTYGRVYLHGEGSIGSDFVYWSELDSFGRVELKDVPAGFYMARAISKKVSKFIYNVYIKPGESSVIWFNNFNTDIHGQFTFSNPYYYYDKWNPQFEKGSQE